MDDSRITIETPVSQPVGPKITDAQIGVYRHDGLGGWHQTATVVDVNELQRFGLSPTHAMSHQVPTPRVAFH